ncbi:MAG TPA: outer membrane protein OmpK [Arsenophonus sp.]
MRKNFLSATILTSLAPFTMASSSIKNPISYRNGFANISLNYFDWSQRAENRSAHTTHKKDFAYLELEGSTNFNWGELYGFFDVENPFHQRKTEPGRNQRYVVKTTGPFATLSAGIQYRYADNKLGDGFYHDGIIYNIKYNF